MTLLKAIIMGIVQGATEFLPVSSSGHLVLFSNILKLDLSPDNQLVFVIMLHIGTLFSIFFVYYKDIWELILGFFGLIKNIPSRNFEIEKYPYRKFTLMIIVASIPTAFIGILFEDIFETLFSTIVPVGVGLLITSFLLFISEKIVTLKKDIKKATFKNALVVGIFQGMAITPGISRSGSTIVGGLLCGFSKELAIKFSFLVSMPAVLGSALFKILDLDSTMIKEFMSLPYLVGTIFSAITGFICIKLLIKILKDNKLHYFSYYTFVIGIIAIVFGIIN